MSTKYIALMTISKTVEPGQAKTLTSPGKRPVVNEVAPGTILTFDADDKDLGVLLSQGAVRKWTKEDAKGIPETSLNQLSEGQVAMSATDAADLVRLREADAERQRIAAAEAAAANGGNGGGKTDPYAGLTTHAAADKYLADKGYTIEGWGGEGKKTVAEKVAALKQADDAAAAAALV